MQVAPFVRKWLVFVVPAVAVAEILLHLHQVRSVIPDDDWKRAKAEVEQRAKPDDLVAFAPRWVDPIGREFFGSSLATLEREGYPDTTRFPRAIEVSIRGEHLDDLAGWKEVEHTKVGDITITTLANPSPVTVLDDLLKHVGQPDMHVSLDGRECAFGRYGVQSGNLGFGPAVPSMRYQCGGNAFAGISIVADLDYRARRCLFAPPQGQAKLRFRFDGIAFGNVLHGHHGLYVEAERELKGSPITLVFRSGEETLGTVVHRDGDGWKPFDLNTVNLAGKTAELNVELSSGSNDRRLYCFEADTR